MECEVGFLLGLFRSFSRGEIPVVKISDKSVRVCPEDLEDYILNNLDMGNGQAAW